MHVEIQLLHVEIPAPFVEDHSFPIELSWHQKSVDRKGKG